MFQRQTAKLALSHRTLDTVWDGSLFLPDAAPKCSGVLTREELRVSNTTPNEFPIQNGISCLSFFGCFQIIYFSDLVL